MNCVFSEDVKWIGCSQHPTEGYDLAKNSLEEPWNISGCWSQRYMYNIHTYTYMLCSTCFYTSTSRFLMIQPCSTHHFSMAKAAFLRLTFQQAQGMRHVAQVLWEEMILPGPGPAGSCFWDFLKHQTDGFFG